MIAGILEALGQWTLFVVWTMVLTTASLFVYLGLGGTFIVWLLALVYGLVTDFDPMSWSWLLTLLGLAVAGELLEFLVGTFYVAGRGATRLGVASAFAGGLIGAAIGQAGAGVVGAMAGSFGGGFVGAVVGEYAQHWRLEHSLRVGYAVLVGRSAAMLLKHAIALTMVFLILRLSLPG